MFALILHSDPTPITIGSNSGWLMFAGRIIRPIAISSRMNSGVTFSTCATYAISSVMIPLRAKCRVDDGLGLCPACQRAASARRFAIHSARGAGTV